MNTPKSPHEILERERFFLGALSDSFSLYDHFISIDIMTYHLNDIWDTEGYVRESSTVDLDLLSLFVNLDSGSIELVLNSYLPPCWVSTSLISSAISASIGFIGVKS